MEPSAEGRKTTNLQKDRGEACWLLPVTIHGVSMNFLVDTGANKTLMNHPTFKENLPDFTHALKTETLKMVAANDTAIEVYGEIELEFEIRHKTFPIMVTIAKLPNVDGILGMDFLRRQNILLDVGGGFVQIDGQSIPMIDKKHLQLNECRVRAIADFVLAPQHEITVKGRIENPQGHEPEACGTLDQLQSFAEQTGLRVANALVQAERGQVPVTLINLLDRAVEVKKGTVMAVVGGVVEVAPPREHNEQAEMTRVNRICVDEGASNLPAHLLEMYEETTKNLDDGRVNSYRRP